MIFATPTAADRFAPQLPADKIKAEHTACFNGSATEGEYITCAQKLLNVQAYDDMRSLLQTALMHYPKSVDGWNALGVAEHQSKKFEDAVTAFKKVLSLSPKNSKTKSNLKASQIEVANTLRENNQFEEAVAVYAEIAAAWPQDVHVQHNIGTIKHMQLSQLDDAIKIFNKVVRQQPADAHAWLSLANCYLDNRDGENMARIFKKSKHHKAGNDAVATMQAVLNFQTNASYTMPQIDDLPLQEGEAFKAFQANNIFRGFVEKLSAFKQENMDAYALEKELPTCNFMGDSHILSAAHLPLKLGGTTYRAAPYLHGGKLFNLTKTNLYRSKYLLKTWANKVDANAPLIISYGEIDCRAEGGFLSYFEKNPSTDRDTFMREQIVAYIAYIQEVCPQKEVYITSTPPLCPINAEKHPTLLPVVALFNSILKEEATAAKMGYIDLYGVLSASGTGESAEGNCAEGDHAEEGAHIDRIHISPLAYKKAVEASCA